MQDQTAGQERQPEFKLWVKFLDGNNRTFYSYPIDERKGTVITKFKNLVLTRWAGRVGIAHIYNNKEDRLLLQYQNRSELNEFKPVTQQHHAPSSGYHPERATKRESEDPPGQSTK